MRFLNVLSIYVYVYILIDFPITQTNASVLCQSEYACLHRTENMVVFFVKSNENTYPKGRALMQTYRVVPITRDGMPTSAYLLKKLKILSSSMKTPKYNVKKLKFKEMIYVLCYPKLS